MNVPVEEEGFGDDSIGVTGGDCGVEDAGVLGSDGCSPVDAGVAEERKEGSDLEVEGYHVAGSS